jgi:hypothetical protein
MYVSGFGRLIDVPPWLDLPGFSNSPCLHIHQIDSLVETLVRDESWGNLQSLRHTKHSDSQIKKAKSLCFGEGYARHARHPTFAVPCIPRCQPSALGYKTLCYANGPAFRGCRARRYALCSAGEIP